VRLSGPLESDLHAKDDLRPASFPEEVARELRTRYRKLAIRYVIACAVLFAATYTVVRWSGATVRFAAARTGGRAVPTWTVAGVVRNSITHDAVPWVNVAGDPAGLPAHFRTEADLHGSFELTTIAEPHLLRITAPGYRSVTIPVGRTWFLWRPRGREQRDVELTPEP
jgi:hypothetical protein